MIDVSGALDGLTQVVIVKTVEKTTVDFIEQRTITTRQQACVVQDAQKEKLNPDTVDWSLHYLTLHSKQPLGLNEFVEYDGQDFRITEVGQWGDYGYYTCTAEEYKGNL